MVFVSTLLGLTTPLLLGSAATLLFGKRKSISNPYPGLLFHSITPSPREMSHYPQSGFRRFCYQLRKHHYQPYTLNSISASPPDRKSLLITFDDGLQSIFRYGLPLLEEYAFKATIFCLSGYYGAQSHWDVFSNNTHLDKEQIRTLHTLGHEIGSHTRTHAYLPFMPEKEVKKELVDSKAELEDIIGSAVTSLSFPFGGWNRDIWQIAREAGYEKATLYRNHALSDDTLYPVSGVYRFDSPEDILRKVNNRPPLSVVRARTAMMAHFAKGTPVWLFRKSYTRL